MNPENSPRGDSAGPPPTVIDWSRQLKEQARKRAQEFWQSEEATAARTKGRTPCADCQATLLPGEGMWTPLPGETGGLVIDLAAFQVEPRRLAAWNAQAA